MFRTKLFDRDFQDYGIFTIFLLLQFYQPLLVQEIYLSSQKPR